MGSAKLLELGELIGAVENERDNLKSRLADAERVMGQMARALGSSEINVIVAAETSYRYYRARYGKQEVIR